MSKPIEAIFRPALVLMSGRFLGFTAAFLIPIVLARLFTQSEFGAYKQLFLIYGTLFAIAQMGVAESLYYFMPSGAGRGSARYISNTLLVLGVLGLVCLAGLVWLREPIAGLMNNADLAPYMPYIGLYLLFMLMSVVLEILMTVGKQYRQASMTYAATDFGRALLYIAPAVLIGGLEGLLLGAVVFALLRLVLTVFYVRQRFAGELGTNRACMREHLLYAVPFGIAALVEILKKNFHLYTVSYNFDAAMFAIYAVGCLQIPLVDFLMTSTANVMMINMREKTRAGALGEAVRIWLDATRKMALLCVPLVTVMILLGHELIVFLFTRNYLESVTIFQVFTLSTVLTCLMTNAVLRVFAQVRFLILLNLVQLVTVALIIFPFMHWFGVLGGVLATLVTSVVARVIALARMKTIMQVSLSQILPWASLLGIVALSLAAALPAWLVVAWAALPPLPTLMLGGTVYGIAYLALLLGWGPLDDEEKQMLTQWLGAPVIRLYQILKV